MVIYNPKDWWKLILSFSKSDTFRIMLPGIFGMAAFTLAVVYVELEVISLSYKNTTTIHAMVGFVLSMLLVFRTNTAYDRWWEGRKAWGSFVNGSRSLALKLNTMVDDASDRQRIRLLLRNYIYAVKEHLRDGVRPSDLKETDRYSVYAMLGGLHVPNRILKYLHEELALLRKSGTINDTQMLLLAPELQSFADQLGICERIRKTPIPYSYSIFLKKIIFIYIASMPFGFAMEFGYWSVAIVSVLFYIFGSIELLAEEIEDPFGTDDNDLPTDQIAHTIDVNLEELLA